MFWRHVNGRRKFNCVPNNLELDGQTATADEEKVKLFAQFFSSVYVNHEVDSTLEAFVDNRNDHGYGRLIISKEAVEVTLESMKLNKGASPDLVSPLIFHNVVICWQSR